MVTNETDDSWKLSANCRDNLNPDIFYSELSYEQVQAMQVCDQCIVRDECLEYALKYKEIAGIRGGATEKQRRRIIRLRRTQRVL